MHKKKIDNFTTALMCLAPMIIQYKGLSSFILLPELILITLLPIYLLRNSEIRFKKIIWITSFVFLSIFLTLINALKIDVDLLSTISTLTRFFFYIVVVIFIGHKYINSHLAIKWIVVIGILNSLYSILQLVSYNLLSITLPWYFPFLSPAYGTELINNSNYYFSTYGFRPSGLFSEPAHLVQYVAISLCLLLTYERFKIYTKIIMAIPMISVMFLASSGTGFVFGILIITIVLIDIIKNKNLSKQSVLKIYFAIISFLFLIFVIFNSSNLRLGLDRILSISETSTLFIRVIRPLEVFQQIPFFHKIFGVGYGNYGHYLQQNNLLSSYETLREVTWTNTFGFVLVGTGVIGAFLFLSFFVYLLKISSGYNFYLGIILFLSMFFSDLILTINFVLLVSLILNGNLREDVKSRYQYKIGVKF